MKLRNMLLICITIFILLVPSLYAAGTGTINGQVTDAETGAPLPGANVIVTGTQTGAATDDHGEYTIRNVPPGSYVLKFDYIGYEGYSQTDVIVRPGRITRAPAALHMSVLEGEAVTVSAGYFTETEDQPVSIVNFSREEIRRAPGVGGDVSRIMLSLPAVAKVNDQSNQLVVRGGSPWENTFYVDNIEIPNINHFPDMATSSGPIGLLNIDFIEDVNFYTGGFGAQYGDKLSSVMDIRFRDGNNEEFDGQLDLNFSGFGGVFEGPLFTKKGSWMVSLRRSYLDYLIKAFDAGTSLAPVYGDGQAKLVYNINPQHKLSLVVVYSDDHNAPKQKDAQENAMSNYGSQDLYNSTLGVNWRALWGKRGYSNTSVSWTSEEFREDWYKTWTGARDLRNHATEQSVKLRNVNHLRLGPAVSLEFGGDAKHIMVDYDNWFASTTSSQGVVTPAFTYIRDENTDKLGGFAAVILHPVAPLTLNLGVRGDYFAWNENAHVSPRFSFTYQLSPLTSLNGSAGLFYQNLPMYILAQREAYKQLDDPRAVHLVLGVEHLLNESVKLTVEAYSKTYTGLPLDPAEPQDNVIDQSYHANLGDLVDTGEAESYGVEFTLQKKLAEDVYGLVGGTWFRSKYRDDNDVWRNRDYDNRYTFSVEGGYKPSPGWEVSMRWIYAGGVPYTPLDLAASAAQQRNVYDDTAVNTRRYPDYHSLNLRMDRRFAFRNSYLVAYVSVWNAYNHKNIARYYWDDQKLKRETETQWNILPIFGLEYEF